MANETDTTSDTLRDAVEAAMETAPKEEVAPAAIATESEATPIGEETAEQKADRLRDEKGRFAKAEAKVKEITSPESASQPLETKPKVEVPAATEPAKPEIKPPQSWKPTVREKWASIPDEVRQEVIRRERETAVALQESSEARQGYQKFRETVAPYEAMIRAEGGEPLRAVESLLQTAAALRTAPLQTKAQMVAQMVRQYLPGREGIELLDAALSGEAHPSHQPQYTPPVDIDRRVEEVLARRDAERQRQEISQRVTQSLAEVEGEEFYEDVRGDMADLLELAVKRGFAMTPREAYNRAVLVHPEISKVLEQRRAASRGNGTAKSQAAAVSVKSTPAAGDTSAQPTDLRSTILAAMNRER